MLTERTFEAIGDGVLYHYCTPGTFQAICENKSLRFSDIFSMNDFMEMHWGYGVWESVATNLVPELGKEFIDSIDEIFSASGFNILPLAACFSTQGDVLSQWRAYADDGTGYCIGFKAKHLTELPARPLQVLYDKQKQEQELAETIRSIHELRSKGELSDVEFFEVCATLSCDLAAFKNPAFVEESEVRFLHVVSFSSSNNGLKLEDMGGISYGESADPKLIGFTMRGSTPVPHIDLNFLDPNELYPISEVILGPKNDALPTAVSVFLETVGIGNAIVKKSVASYR